MLGMIGDDYGFRTLGALDLSSGAQHMSVFIHIAHGFPKRLFELLKGLFTQITKIYMHMFFHLPLVVSSHSDSLDFKAVFIVSQIRKGSWIEVISAVEQICHT